MKRTIALKLTLSKEKFTALTETQVAFKSMLESGHTASPVFLQSLGEYLTLEPK